MVRCIASIRFEPRPEQCRRTYPTSEYSVEAPVCAQTYVMVQEYRRTVNSQYSNHVMNQSKVRLVKKFCCVSQRFPWQNHWQGRSRCHCEGNCPYLCSKIEAAREIEIRACHGDMGVYPGEM